MSESEITKKCPEIYQALLQQNIEVHWNEVFSHLEKLNWLAVPDSVEQILYNAIKIIDDLKPGGFSVIQLDHCLLYLNSLVFSISVNKRQIDKHLDDFLQHCNDLSFFKIYTSEKIFQIEPKFSEMCKLIHKIFMHLENPFISNTKKTIPQYLNDLFYNYYISGFIEELTHSKDGIEILKKYPKPRYFYIPYFSRLPQQVNNYFGEYLVGKRSGYGLISLMNGDSYKGEFKNGLMHGSGVYYWAAGGFYEGCFENGVIHGVGVEHYVSGNVYSGEYFKGKKHGKGELKFVNGDKYIGEWKNNYMEGEGEYIWSTGVIFKGWFVKDKRNGRGEITMENGKKYNDEWGYDDSSY